MQDRIYLLSIAEFLEESDGEVLINEALNKIDAGRREKALRIKQKKAAAASIGAGLLLQWMAKSHYEQKADEKWITFFSVRELLDWIEMPITMEFSYGKGGKPYWKTAPFYFNLSHSGEYVVCVVSEQEIGIDIQVHCRGNEERIAKRYFATEEIRALEECDLSERTQRFYDMWAAKEAYGKYTGGGIAESLSLDITGCRVALQMIHRIPGYSLAICKALEGGNHE